MATNKSRQPDSSNQQQKGQSQQDRKNVNDPGSTGSKQEQGNNQDKESKQRFPAESDSHHTDALNEQVRNQSTELEGTEWTPKMNAEEDQEEMENDENSENR